jgi:hypothetical protein
MALVVDAQGVRCAIVYRGFSDAHFFSISAGNRHGAVHVAAVDQQRLGRGRATQRRPRDLDDDDEAEGNRDHLDAPPRDSLAEFAAAVDSEVVLGRKDAPAASVIARRLAATLGAAGDFRPLTLNVGLPEPPETWSSQQRTDFVLGLVDACVLAMTPSASANA